MLEEREGAPFLLGEAGKGLRWWRDGTAHQSIGEREEMCFLAPSPASPRPAGGEGAATTGLCWGVGAYRGSPWAEQVGMSETDVYVGSARRDIHCEVWEENSSVVALPFLVAVPAFPTDPSNCAYIHYGYLQ